MLKKNENTESKNVTPKEDDTSDKWFKFC
jgi:hypothetical protein